MNISPLHTGTTAFNILSQSAEESVEIEIKCTANAAKVVFFDFIQVQNLIFG